MDDEEGKDKPKETAVVEAENRRRGDSRFGTLNALANEHEGGVVFEGIEGVIIVELLSAECEDELIVFRDSWSRRREIADLLLQR